MDLHLHYKSVEGINRYSVWLDWMTPDPFQRDKHTNCCKGNREKFRKLNITANPFAGACRIKLACWEKKKERKKKGAGWVVVGGGGGWGGRARN